MRSNTWLLRTVVLRALRLGVGLAVAPQVLQSQILIDGPAGLAPAIEAAAADPASAQILLLEGGEWGPLSIRDVVMPGKQPLVIRAADPANPPRFGRVNLAGVGNVTLEDLVFDYEAEEGDDRETRPFQLRAGSHGIVLRGVTIEGDEVDGSPVGFGLSLRGVHDVTIEGSVVRGFLRGIVVSESAGITIRGNDVYGMRSDGMDFAQVEGVLIEGNRVHDFVRRPVGARDHPDMIQFWTAGTDRPSRDITITSNLLYTGQGDWTQSIFMRNEMVDRGAGEEMFYRNIRIEGNLIVNAHLHGITVGHALGVVVANNTLARNPGSAGEDPARDLWTPRIRVAGASRDVAIVRNAVAAIDLPEDLPSGWTVEGNLSIQDRGRLEPGFYGLVFSGGDPADPASFAPRLGGPLDGTGIGAPIAVDQR